MLESNTVITVQRRLSEMGCPPELFAGKIRELTEHREDLKQNALEEGLSEPDAEARADQLLGEPYALAERLAAALRQSSWWGRHPVIGFCVLPPVVIIAVAILAAVSVLWLGQRYFTTELMKALASEKSGALFFQQAWDAIYLALTFLVLLTFSRMSRRTASGFKWALIVSCVGALFGWMFRVQIVPHCVVIVCSTQPHWVGVVPSLAVAALFWCPQTIASATRRKHASNF